MISKTANLDKHCSEQSTERKCSTNSEQASDARQQFRGQRLTDIVLASGGILLLCPIILLRAVLSVLLTGRLPPQRPKAGRPEDTPSAVRFAGALPGAPLAALFCVIKGSHTLVESPMESSRPGLCSDHKIRRNTGVEYLQPGNPESTISQWNISTYFRILAKSLLAALTAPVGDLKAGRFFCLFGIRIINTTISRVVDDCEHILTSGVQTSIGFVNADCMNKCFSDARYHQTLRAMDRVYPDGIGVRLASQMFGTGVEDNINGTDLFPKLCKRLAGTSQGIFLLGARQGVAEAVAENVSGRYPGLVISGCQHGYFTEAEEDDVIERINRSGATVLLVALGAPQQELWLARNRARLDAKILMAVGGLFDFYSGRISRAPIWMREVGLEWSWRLLQEPGRMWRRYLVGNPRFLYCVWKQKKQNGSVARSMEITPAEETRILDHFSRLGQAAALRSVMMGVRHAYWRWLRSGSEVLKRILDITVGALALIVLSPLFALVIILIRLESPGSAFFSQTRVGYRGELFTLWKFRSMYIDAEKRRAELQTTNEMAGGVIFKMKRDPRVTRVGRFIRKFSIDELPQLWNVIRGEMSLVGPRPALPSEVKLYTIEQRVRLLAKPGLTCIWQVEGRSDIPFSQQVQLDEDYIYRQSLLTDIKLLLRTIPAVLGGKGAC